MKTLSLKLENDIFDETEKVLAKAKKNRNRYINEAVDFYNKLHRRKALAKKLAYESKRTAKESVKILAEFENLDDAATAI